MAEALQAQASELLKYLRDEAWEVKNCFTQFSFQVVALSAIALGLIAKFQPTFPLLGLASVAIILLALSVGRIGIYKYTTANRQYAFSLFVERVRHLKDSSGWKQAYLDIGWEEALRAWRTVQPTIFRHYYHWGSIRLNRLKKEFQRLEYPWFEPDKLHTLPAVYYSGSYLRTMFSILFILIALCLCSLYAMTVQAFILDETVLGYASLCLAIVMTIMSGFKVEQLTVRRHLLEKGFHSIHSSAIVWQVVVTAHYRALADLGADEDGKLDSLRGYTQALSKQAVQITQYLGNSPTIDDWLYRGQAMRHGIATGSS